MRGTEPELVELVVVSSMLDRGCSFTLGTKYSEGVQSMWLIVYQRSGSYSSFSVGSVATPRSQ